jgi:mono/diheme cytochrome c family protein
MRRRLALIAAVGIAAMGVATSSLRADDVAERELGRQLFRSVMPSCATCHTLQAAEATGTVGPSLDELKPDAARVETALREGLNAMPAYADTLSDAQIRALARFIDEAT